MRSSHVSIRCTTLEHRRARLYAVCRGPFPAAGAALGLQPAASAVSWGNPSQMQGGDGGIIARLGNRAAATGTIHRAAPCSKAPPGQFTPGTDEQCSGRRLASRRVCCARIVSPSAVCTPASDDMRTRSPHCPSLARFRHFTLRAAIHRMPRAISGGGRSFGTAASCIGRVVG
jgi:hypothetical protein